MNIKALNVDELKFFLDRYDIRLIENTDYLLVSCKNQKKQTLHELKDFNLCTPIRKMKISKEAIDIWKEKYVNVYSLIEVQNAINYLILTYSNVSSSQIDKQLKKMKSKFNNTI